MVSQAYVENVSSIYSLLEDALLQTKERYWVIVKGEPRWILAKISDIYLRLISDN